jgi:hypothetical protein
MDEVFLRGLLESQLGNIPTEISAIRILISLVFGYAIGMVYRYSHTGISYSSNFTFTIVAASFLACAILIIVGENVARAFALVGALAIIRFRTVVKDPKDLVFIFASLVIGMAVGVGMFLVSLIVFMIFSLTAIVMKTFKLFAIDDFENIIRFTCNEKIKIDDINALVNKYFNNYQLLTYETIASENRNYITFETSAITESDFNQLKNEINSEFDGVSFSFVAGNSSITY